MTQTLPAPPDAAAPADLESAPPADVVAWALRRFDRGRVALVTGLQKEGTVLLDMALRIDPEVRVVTIDTGRLPAETHAFLDTLRARYGRDIEVSRPDPSRVVDFVRRHGPDAFYVDPDLRLACCQLRKVEPSRALLGGLDAWLTGLRRGQSTLRAATAVVQTSPDGDPVKVSPLAAVSSEWVDTYIHEHDVPVHPLYTSGYRSIGCAPCTRAVTPGADERSGRWWWETGVDSECGIHRRPVATREGAS